MFNLKEKDIQKNILRRLSLSGYKYNIIDEEGKDLNLNNEHNFLILDHILDVNGLRYYIAKNNQSIINEFSNIHSKSEIVSILLNDFIEKYNKTKSNADIYKLIFNPGGLSISIKNNKGLLLSRDYNVIYHSNYADNQFTIIKEKRIDIGYGNVERPDFAMYINGIPLIVFEVKTKKAGLDAAFKDYTLKKSYSKFILCVGTDGEDAFITGSKVSKCHWKKYGKNKVKGVFEELNAYINNYDDIISIESIIERLKNESDKREISEIERIVNSYTLTDLSLSEEFKKIKQYQQTEKNSVVREIFEVLQTESTELEDLISELFDSPKNLFFYMKNCILIDKSEYSGEFLINHHVQQYYTVKKLNNKLFALRYEKEDSKKKEKKHSLLNELVVHVQRSGKSITMRSAVNLIANCYKDIFSKLYICVPDLTILKVMEKTFKHNNISVKKIKSRNEYIESINKKTSGFCAYLYNIQKTTDGENDLRDLIIATNVNKYENDDILFIIDEVHFAQDKLQSQIRHASFPYASFLSFTATPKITEKSEQKINKTAILYSNSDSNGNISYLDELILEDAIAMNIVLPVRYEKLKFQQNSDLELSKEIDAFVIKDVEKVLEQGEYAQRLKLEQEESERHIRLKNIQTTEDKIQEIIIHNNNIIHRRHLEKALKEIEKVEKEMLMYKLRKEKLDFIVNDMNSKRENCYSINGKLSFKTKAFLVVKSQDEAKKYLSAVKEMSKNDENIYKGYHFGVDFSQQQLSTNEDSEISILNKIGNDEKIISYFESQKDDDSRVDVLIIVDKYLMGYDNKELVAVYCDKTINEPAKLFQLITRSATVREGKKQGFFVDMTFDVSNYNTYVNKALLYYNTGGAKIQTLDDYDIEILKDRINGLLNDIKVILEIPEEEKLVDTIQIYKKLISKDATGQLPSSIIMRKNRYFDKFKEINNILETLINPKYYLDQFDEILSLAKVNLQYLNENMPKVKEEGLVFDRNDIEQVILRSLKFFNFDSVDAFNTFKITGSTNKDEVKHPKVLFNNIVDDFRVTLACSRMRVPLGFTEMITKLSDQILTAEDAKIAINDFIKDIVDPFNKKQEERKERIEREFEGSLYRMIAHEQIEELNIIISEKIQEKSFSKTSLNYGITLTENSLNEEERENMLKIYVRAIGDYFEDFMLNNQDINNMEELVEKLILYKDLDKEKINEINNNFNIKKAIHLFQKRIKDIVLNDGVFEFDIENNEDLDSEKSVLIYIAREIFLEMKNNTLNI